MTITPTPQAEDNEGNVYITYLGSNNVEVIERYSPEGLIPNSETLRDKALIKVKYLSEILNDL